MHRKSLSAALLAAAILVFAGCPGTITVPAATYGVEYRADGASGAVPTDSARYAAGASVTVAGPGGLARTGYVFAAWNGSADGSGLSYAPGAFATMGSADLVLYAQWTKSDYRVSFDSRGGSAVEGLDAEYGSLVSAPADPALAGYAFGGWYKTADLAEAWDFAVDTVPAEAITLYAKWGAVSYTISYALNGGENAPGNPTSYTIESEAIALANPSRASYDFAGWYASDTFQGDAVTEVAKGSTGNKALYAKWTPISYSISYSLNGGQLAAGYPASYTIESPAIALPVPTMAGYSFAGWYAASDLSGSATTTIAAGSSGDKAFYAKWLPIPAVAIALPSGLVVNGLPANDTVALGTVLSLVASITDDDGYTEWTWSILGEKGSRSSDAKLEWKTGLGDPGVYSLQVKAVTSSGRIYSETIAITVTRS